MNKNEVLKVLQSIKKHGDSYYFSNDFIYILQSKSKIVSTIHSKFESIPVVDKPQDDSCIRIKNETDLNNVAYVLNKDKTYSEIQSEEIISIANQFKKINSELKKTNAIIQIENHLLLDLLATIKEFKSTHIQFVKEDNKNYMRAWNVGKFVNQDFEHGAYADIEIYEDIFECCFRTNSLTNLIKTDDYEIYFYKNFVVFNSLQNEFEQIIRLQELSIPLLNFSLPNKQRMSFLFAPNLDL